jgi:hypothetical protein
MTALSVILSFPAIAQITNGVKLFKGIISDTKTGQPVDGGRVWVYQGSQAEPVTNSKINPGTGKYQVILNPSTEYRFVLKSPKYYNTEVKVTTPPGGDYEETVRDFTMEVIPLGSTIFNGRLFAPGSSELKVNTAFQQMVDLMKREKGIVAMVAVVPDALAPESKPAPAKAKPAKKKKGKKNAPEPEETVTAAPAPQAMNEEQLKALGQERATAIKNYFKEQNISITRLDWDIKSGQILNSSSSLPDNVVVTIKKIEVEDDE